MGNLPIDIENETNLLTFLSTKGLIDSNHNPRIRVLEGGVSNKTVLIEMETGKGIVVKQALKKLRVKADWYSSPERIYKEAEGLRWFIKIIPQHVPEFLIEDREQHILGMTAIPNPHKNWKSMLCNGEINQRHAEKFGHILAQIHNAVNTYPELSSVFEAQSFFETLRLEPYYAYSAEKVPETHSFLYNLIENTRKRRFSLVHGDYSPKNVLIYNRALFILDHEVVHFGDPAFDVGFALTHFISKANHFKSNSIAFFQMATSFWQAYIGLIDNNLYEENLELFSVQHSLACLLARVEGRSPLEYLTEEERDKQKNVVLALMQNQPKTIQELIRCLQSKFNDQ